MESYDRLSVVVTYSYLGLVQSRLLQAQYSSQGRIDQQPSVSPATLPFYV